MLLHLADVAIERREGMVGGAGEYRVPPGSGLARVGALPALTVGWAGGAAVAAAGSAPASVDEGPALAWLGEQPAARRPELGLRLACAVAAGRGLLGERAHAAPVGAEPPFAAPLEQVQVRVAGEDVSVRTRCRGPLVVAVAIA